MLLVLVKLMGRLLTNSQGATVVITNANNDVVANTGLVAGTYTLTATATGNEGQNCATAQVTITQPEILVSVSGIATNATCFGEADGSIAVTNSQGATVVITNANDVVANTGLVAGTYTPIPLLVVMKVKTVLLLLK
jgi:predicted membrane channel-forming protein YqfA (hemolysin III family)